MRVASRGAEQLGLSQSHLERAKQEFEAIKDALEQSERKSKNISDRFYRQFRPRPLLMLHILQPWSEERPAINPVVALGISIPACEALNNRSVKYAFNVVKQREYEQGFLDMDEDFEDDV